MRAFRTFAFPKSQLHASRRPPTSAHRRLQLSPARRAHCQISQGAARRVETPHLPSWRGERRVLLRPALAGARRRTDGFQQHEGHSGTSAFSQGHRRTHRGVLPRTAHAPRLPGELCHHAPCDVDMPHRQPEKVEGGTPGTACAGGPPHAAAHGRTAGAERHGARGSVRLGR